MLTKADFKKSRNKLEQASTPKTAEKIPEVPDDFCISCPSCKHTILSNEFEENHYICPYCGYYFRMSARQRIALICDVDSFREWDMNLKSIDPLNFPGYKEKLKQSQEKSGEQEAVVTGKAKIGGFDVAFFAMEPNFIMGSMGSVVGEKITRLFERAIEEKLPVVGFTLSGGARMQEGTYSLIQMAKTSGAVKKHSDAGLLYITVLTDPTTGGVTASFAMEGDILLAEPGALIGFTGPRVIEQTIRQKLPKGFQRSEFLLEHGFLDSVVPREKLKNMLIQFLRLHMLPEVD